MVTANLKPKKVLVKHSGPYSLDLSLRAVASFLPKQNASSDVLRVPTMCGGTPAIIEIRQKEVEPPVLQVSSAQQIDAHFLRQTARWVTIPELDLTDFYNRCKRHQKLSQLTGLLYGLKHLRPVSLFEMVVIAIIEQQISLTAAYHIRVRLIKRFGHQIDELWVFPEPERLAQAGIPELAECGLSYRKAEYVNDIAVAVQDGSFDLDSIREMTDEDARTYITARRGLGRWSADYILIRGLARTDAVPADDLGIRTVVGELLGDGARVTSAEVERTLAPFSPYRGLVTFYLLAYSRLYRSDLRR